MNIPEIILLPVKKILSVELLVTDPPAISSVLEVIKKSDSIEISGCFDELPETSHQAIVLNISGPQVIVRRCSNGQELESFIQNLDRDEFIIQEISDSHIDCYLAAFIRKESCDYALQLTGLNRRKIAAISLGSSLLHLLPEKAIFYDDEILQMPLYSLHNANGDFIQDFSQKHKSIASKLNLFGDAISATTLISYVSAITFLTGGVHHLFRGPKHIENLQEIRARVSTIKISKIALVSVFTIALLNFAIYAFFESQSRDLKSEYQTIIPVINKNSSLEKQIEQLRKELQIYAVARPLTIALICDAIIHCMPEKIILKRLEVFPEKEQIQNDPPTFESDVIRIQGRVPQPVYIDQWMQMLNEISWIKSVRLENFKRNRRNMNPEFEILIEIQS